MNEEFIKRKINTRQKQVDVLNKEIGDLKKILKHKSYNFKFYLYDGEKLTFLTSKKMEFQVKVHSSHFWFKKKFYRIRGHMGENRYAVDEIKITVGMGCE